MTLQVFPTTTGSYPIKIDETYNTLVGRYDAKNVQRRARWRFPLRTISLPYGKMTAADRNTLHAFFRARRGAYESFWYVHNESLIWTDEYMGRGTGAALTLDLHGKSTSVRTIYEDDVAQVAGVDYNISAGTGEASRDQAVWIAGYYPAVGALITHTFTGLLGIKCYLGDQFSHERFDFLRSKTDLILYEEDEDI